MGAQVTSAVIRNPSRYSTGSSTVSELRYQGSEVMMKKEIAVLEDGCITLDLITPETRDKTLPDTDKFGDIVVENLLGA
jgi:hypothetical protein